MQGCVLKEKKALWSARLTTYESYYAGRAQLWELQALNRARAISGPLKNEFMESQKPPGVAQARMPTFS